VCVCVCEHARTRMFVYACNFIKILDNSVSVVYFVSLCTVLELLFVSGRTNCVCVIFVLPFIDTLDSRTTSKRTKYTIGLGLCIIINEIVSFGDMDMHKESGKQNTSNWDEILKANNGKDQERERIRNAPIREELRMGDIQNQIEGSRLRWFGHVKRKDEHRIPKRLLEVSWVEKDLGADHEHDG
jgi:hypothetical protein